MRKQVKASGVAEGHFSIGKGAGATPTEARTPKNSGPAATPKTPGSRKRKSGQTGSAKKSAADADAVDADADYDAYVDIDTPSKKPRGQSVVKAEHEDVGDSQKRVRGQSQRPEMMVDHPSDPEAPGLDDDEFDLENSGSGYVPDNSIDSGKEIKIEG